MAEGRRLFLALWPDEAVRAAVAATAAGARGGRRVAAEKLHLTLVFLGPTAGERRLCYERALEGLAVPPMVLDLDLLGAWRGPAVLWLGTSAPVPELAALVGEIHRRLAHCGFRPERRPFHAHVTLARRFRGRAPPGPVSPAIRWRAGEVVLVETVAGAGGSGYRVLRRWPPGPGGASNAPVDVK